MERISRSRSGKAPLVLVHDGGGTTASYHALKDLDRDIFGIENPLLYASKPWKGGIRAMARAYSALIELELGRTSILVGGWSFGGLVALGMVEVLNDEYSIEVIGVLLIDSVCPSSRKFGAALDDHHRMSVASASCFSSRLLVMNMMKHSILMAEQWQPPQWQSKTSDPGNLDCCCAELARYPEATEAPSRQGPLVVLVRCLGRLSSSENAVARVDVSRDCKTLGWEHTRPGLVSYTLQCSATHFNLFTTDFVHETTERIREALSIMEGRDVLVNDG